MGVVKIITLLNWLVIAILAFLVIAEVLSPHKGGGDAATKGLGQAMIYAAIFAVVVLSILNLLPYNWSKYAAFALILTPFVWMKVTPAWDKMKRDIQAREEDAKPIFADPELDHIAKTIRDGQLEEVKQMLLTPPPHFIKNGELLAYAISEANYSSYKAAEKLECVRLLFQAGARLDSVNHAGEIPIHIAVAEVGNAALMRLLLEQGADPNAQHIYFKRPVLFEAIGAYREPEATVRVLLDFGADPNATAIFDDDEGAVTPLLRAATLERWGICVALLEHGANPEVKTNKGSSFREIVLQAGDNFSPGGYSTQEDFDRLKQLLAGR